MGSSSLSDVLADEESPISVIATDEPPSMTIDEFEALAARLRREMPALVSAATLRVGDEGLPGMLFDDCRASADAGVILVSAAAAPEPIWMIGDVHGDLLGLEILLRYIADRTPQDRVPQVLLLGDLFDDGIRGSEVLLRVFELLVSGRHRIGWIAGNHDEALQASDQGFSSSVSPCEFSEWLNQQRHVEGAERLGQLVVNLVQRLPRAIFLPDGILAAHGGVPHVDLLPRLTSVDDLEAFECQQDFVWTRLHERAKRRIPNRSTRGCELGREDFAAFCQRMSELLGYELRGIVRGHDHIDDVDRYRIYQQYRPHIVVTINTMSHRLERESFGDFVRRPCVVRWEAGRPLEIHCVPIPERLVRQACRTSGEAEEQPGC